MAGLYIHIPFCKSKCAYCDFPSFAGREGDAGRYFHAVMNEAVLWRERFSFGNSPGFVFDTVFIGGGTPSLLPAGELERLMDGMSRILNIQPVEFTVEANPGTVDKGKLESFRRMGAGRISFGAQATQDRLLKRIGRIHTWADFTRSFALAREAGFDNIGADMMTGLPGQAMDDAVETAEKLTELGLEHVSCYGLIMEEGTPLAQAVHNGDETVPSDDEEREMFHAARAVLEGAGLRRYEISNFARPGRECRHNLNYWRSGGSLGLGPGAASHFRGYRRENRSGLDEYMQACEECRLPPADEHVIGPEESMFETIMLNLRLAEGLDYGEFEKTHGIDFSQKYKCQVDIQISRGLMRKTPNGIALTERGMDLQNAVLLDFMEEG